MRLRRCEELQLARPIRQRNLNQQTNRLFTFSINKQHLYSYRQYPPQHHVTGGWIRECHTFFYIRVRMVIQWVMICGHFEWGKRRLKQIPFKRGFYILKKWRKYGLWNTRLVCTAFSTIKLCTRACIKRREAGKGIWTPDWNHFMHGENSWSLDIISRIAENFFVC